MSTSILKALPGKLDIKRYSPGILYFSSSSAIVTSSDDTRILKNMVSLVIWTGTYQDRFETFNPRWESGIEAIDAENLTLQDNVIVGSERVGYHVKPLACDEDASRYSNNMAYSNLIGSVILPDDTVTGDCVKMSGFISWKNHDFGLYYQNDPSVIIDNNIVAENGVGLWTGVLKPSATLHEIGNKTAVVSNSLFVGATASYDCDKDVSPVEEDNFEISANARPGKAPNGGMIGLTFTNFYQESNKAPGKPWIGCKAYNSIAGLTKVESKYFMHTRWG